MTKHDWSLGGLIKPITFEEWKSSMNSHVIAKCGMSVDDLPDCAYRDWFDDGVTPETAAKRAIRNAKES